MQDIIDQSWRRTPVGSLIRANLEAAKVEAGLYDSLFDQDLYVTWFSTRDSWVIETYRFCREHEIVFSELGASLLPQCQGDNTIMDEFFRTGFLSKELTTLNRCRLYCRVTSVLDVAEGDGMHLSTRWFNHGTQNKAGPISWPNQGLPTEKDWSFWESALKTSLCRERGLLLKRPLGMWTLPQEKLLEWEWFVSKGLLYQLERGRWYVYPNQIRIRTRQICFSKI